MRLAVALAAMGLLALAGCSGTASPPSSATVANAPHVAAVDNAFQPKTLSVPAGTSVTWSNDGQAPHTVSIEDPKDPNAAYLLDANIEPGQTAKYTFDAAGTYHVVCVYHDGMVMDVTVA